MNLEGPLNDSRAGINYIKIVHKSSMLSYFALTFRCSDTIGILTEDVGGRPGERRWHHDVTVWSVLLQLRRVISAEGEKKSDHGGGYRRQAKRQITGLPTHPQLSQADKTKHVSSSVIQRNRLRKMEPSVSL